MKISGNNQISSSNQSLIEHYQDLYNPISDSVFFIESSGRIIEINAFGCEMFGFAPEDTEHLFVKDLFNLQNTLQVPPEFQWVPSEKTFSKKGQMLHKNGSLFSAEFLWRCLTENLILCIVRSIYSLPKTASTHPPDGARCRQLIEMANEGVWCMNAEHITTYVNPKMTTLLGYKENEMLGKPITDFLFADDLADHVKQMQTHRLGKSDTYQRRFRKKDGETLWALVAATPNTDDQGNYLGSYAMLNDITDNKRLEGILDARLQLMQFAINCSLDDLLQETIDIICFLTNSQTGFYHFVNEEQKTLSLQAWSKQTRQNFCKIDSKGLHYNIEKGGVWTDCFHQRSTVIHNDYKTLPHRKGLPDGHPEVIRELVTPVFRSEKIVAIIGVGNKANDYDDNDIEMVSQFADLAWDIAERKIAEIELRKSEERFRSFIENANDTVYCLSDKGIFTYISPNIGDSLGYQESEFLGKSFETFIHPEDLPRCKNFIYQVFKSGKKHSGIEYRIKHKNGNWHWHTSNASLLKEMGNEPAEYLGISRDISKQKEAEEKLLENEARTRKKLLAITQPEGNLTTLELSDIFDYETMQSLMDEFYKLTNMGIGIIDMKGKVLVATGWQSICINFHRKHPETLKNCIESDIRLSQGVVSGTYKSYKCKNNLWDFSTPIFLGGKQVGNIFLGQFFFENENYDIEEFRCQALQYGFNEELYLAALEEVPRWSHDRVKTAMSFYSKLAGLISTLNFANIQLANTLTEKDFLLEEKNVLLREVHHRVKNNLAAIYGLIEMEQHVITDQTAKTKLIELANRIQSMAIAHEKLYLSKNLSDIDFKEYIQSMITHLKSTFNPEYDPDIQVIMENIILDLDLAIPCGLIVNELLTNALKYAFPNEKSGKTGSKKCNIRIVMKIEGDCCLLSVADNGIGLPPNLDWRTTNSLGLRLVHMLCEHQLGGKVDLDRAEGTKFVINFKLREKRRF